MVVKKQYRTIFGVIFISAAVSLIVLYFLEKDFYYSATGKFRNGQEYSTFKTNEIEVRYPEWPTIEKSRLIEPDKIKLAVSSGECVFVVNSESVAKENSLIDLSEKYIKKRTTEFDSRIVSQKIDNPSSYLEEELKGGRFLYRSFTRFYLSNGNFYKIYMIGEKDGFSKTCLPILEEIFGNIRVK